MEHAIDTLPKQIELGNQGESGILNIDLDCTTWLTDFPTGEILATFLPPDSYTPELLPITQAYVLEDDVTFRVIVMRNMTRYAGKGSLNIRLVVGDDIEKRSAVVGTYTAPSHSTAAEEAPEDVSDWVNEAVVTLAAAQEASEFFYVGEETPTSPNAKIWFDTDEPELVTILADFEQRLAALETLHPE